MFAVAERGGLPSQSASAIRSVETNRLGCRSKVVSSCRGLAARSGWPSTWKSRRGPRIPYLRLSTSLPSPQLNRPIVTLRCIRREARCTTDVSHSGTVDRRYRGEAGPGVATDRRRARAWHWVGSSGSGVPDDGEPVPLLAAGEGWLAVLRAGGTRRRAAHRWLTLSLVRRLSRLTLVRRELGLTAGVVALVTRNLRVDLTRRLHSRLHLRRRLLTRDRADGAERDLRDRPHGLVLDLEVAGLLELEAVRDDVRRERLDPGVVVAHVGVVEPAAGRDPVLGVGQLALQVEEVLVRLQLRVRLDRDHHLTQRAGQLTLRGRPLLGVGALHVHRLGAEPGDLLEHVPLVCGVRAYGLDQVRDQVVAAVQLDVD